MHDILKCVQSDITSGILDLGIHGHSETLANSGKHERPLAPEKWHLHRHQSQNGADNARRVDDDVLLVRILDGSTAFVDVVAEKNNGEESTCQVERPVISHVRNGEEDKDKAGQLVCKDALETSQFFHKVP